MAFHPILHEVHETVRFGRVLFVEISPKSPTGRRCRYCDVLSPESKPPALSHFSVPESAAKVVLSRLERGEPLDAIVFGGEGEPLRHRGLGAILRRIRSATHMPTIVLTDGILLSDRAARRDVREAHTVVAWLPPLDDGIDCSPARRDAFERHVEGIAALRRERTLGSIALELPVSPNLEESEVTREAWRRAIQRIAPERIFVIPAHGAEGEVLASMEAVRDSLTSSAGVFLDDSTPIDRRCFCENSLRSCLPPLGEKG